MLGRVGFVVGRLFRCCVRLLRHALLLPLLLCLLFFVSCCCVAFLVFSRCPGLGETFETIPAQSAERGRGARPRSSTRMSRLLVGCARCSCRSCVAASRGALALALVVLVALVAFASLDVLASLAINALPVPC